MKRFPKFSDSQRIGELGASIVEKVVRKELQWIFRRVHQESDFGIDGYIDLVDESRNVTGKSLAVQIKAGKSYCDATADYGLMYTGEFRHLNIFLNNPAPVLLLVCDEESEVIWWRQFEVGEVKPSESNWKILIPYAQMLAAASKSKLERIAGPVLDHIEPLREQWQIRDCIRDHDFIIFIVPRMEIKANDVSRVIAFFDSLSQSIESALAHEGRIVLSIDGYDHCKKELWEFAEVRRWMKKFEREVNSAFWFLNTTPPSYSLSVLMFCVCDGKIKYRDYIKRRALTETSVSRKLHFITHGFKRLNEFTCKMGVSIDDNRRVSIRVGDYLMKSQQDAEEEWRSIISKPP